MAEIEGFAERIFFLRKAANKNQEEVGAAIGLTKSAVSSFEKGKSIPSPENLVKLGVLFEVSVDYLLTGQRSLIKGEEENNKKSPVHHDFKSLTIKKYKIENINSEIEGDLSEKRELFEQILANSKISELRIVKNLINSSLSPSFHSILPVFDQALIDKRFLTELDRLLRAQVFPTYLAWARAVDVSPNYVSAIEKGRYHFNLELLYNTVSKFPDFDFTYVVFGSALSSRPEPTELPKRERGRRPKVDD
ncbi:hypothetical protein GCM10023172_23000 [Hymenobacter ginsengisoli]|uniref:HTH cro/C1-type domain-containing protein n=1 Tax=Hymenobacter ginsengisoli TaxID=1051626 RepID=A0ABP8QFJ6_9BACT|nr:MULTISPECIES: helix-turn-helix transcriptional regulator [unclassified Hymenobacter]MBO2031936.1 helix-turn-helix domain-containing protein [Hymenobacter sp. BT559]